MRLLSLFSAALILAVALMACNSTELSKSKSKVAGPPGSPAAPAQPPTDGVRRITVAELRDQLAKGDVVIVDVRSEMAFKEARIKGARLIPTNEVLAKAGELPRDKLIVTYCAWPAEQTSAGAVINLKTKGIQNAAALLGGFDAWKNAGLPVESGKK